jgi:hypothetical protein
MRAPGNTEEHRVDVCYQTFAPVARCSCGWRFTPPPHLPLQRARSLAWANAAAHREEHVGVPRRHGNLFGHAAQL